MELDCYWVYNIRNLNIFLFCMPPVKSKVATQTGVTTKVLVLTVAIVMFGFAAIGYGFGFTSFNKSKNTSIKSFLPSSAGVTKINGCAPLNKQAAEYTGGCCSGTSKVASGLCKKLGCAVAHDEKADEYADGCCPDLKNVGGLCKVECADLGDFAASSTSGLCCTDEQYPIVPNKDGICVAK
jgi:hypothetical protein